MRIVMRAFPLVVQPEAPQGGAGAAAMGGAYVRLVQEILGNGALFTGVGAATGAGLAKAGLSRGFSVLKSTGIGAAAGLSLFVLAALARHFLDR